MSQRAPVRFAATRKRMGALSLTTLPPEPSVPVITPVAVSAPARASNLVILAFIVSVLVAAWDVAGSMRPTTTSAATISSILCRISVLPGSLLGHRWSTRSRRKPHIERERYVRAPAVPRIARARRGRPGGRCQDRPARHAAAQARAGQRPAVARHRRSTDRRPDCASAPLAGHERKDRRRIRGRGTAAFAVVITGDLLLRRRFLALNRYTS